MNQHPGEESENSKQAENRSDSHKRPLYRSRKEDHFQEGQPPRKEAVSCALFCFYFYNHPVREAVWDIGSHRISDKGIQLLEPSRGLRTGAAGKNMFLILWAQSPGPGNIFLNEMAGTPRITHSTFSFSRTCLKICFPRKTRDLTVPTGQSSISAISSSESSSK